MSPPPRFLSVIFLGISVVCVTGCQQAASIESNRTAVQGKVTIDERPLTGGCVTLTSEKDPLFSTTAMIRPDGTFSVDNAPEGDVLVAIQTESVKFSNAARYIPIPKRYGNSLTSGLKATVQKNSEKPLIFQLSSK
jgi:hypothetical protein